MKFEDGLDGRGRSGGAKRFLMLNSHASTATPAWETGLLLKQMASAKYVDMHVHTRVSDGIVSPREVVERAFRAGLAGLAIADHDSVDGIQDAIWTGNKLGVEIIPAVELSSGINNHEFHVLGYYVDWQDSWFREKLSKLQDIRRERGKEIIKKLHKLGIDVSYNVIIALDGGVLGRPHIAAAMIRQGHVRTMEEAFDKYLGIGKPAYVAKYPLTPAQAIKLIRKVGGLSVIAHPKFARADHMIPELVEAGLKGIEAYHSAHSAEDTKHYVQLARKYDLLVAGGSDFHGTEDVAIGSIRMPYSFVEKIKEELVTTKRWKFAPIKKASAGKVTSLYPALSPVGLHKRSIAR